MKTLSIRTAETIAAYLNLIRRRGYGPGIDALERAWGHASSVGGNLSEFVRLVGLGQEYARLGKDKWLGGILGRIMALLNRSNPLNTREAALLIREARSHERDAREHKDPFLKTLDMGTAAGLREAVYRTGGPRAVRIAAHSGEVELARRRKKSGLKPLNLGLDNPCRKNPYGKLPQDFSDKTYSLVEQTRAPLPAGLPQNHLVYNFVEGDKVIRYITRYEGPGNLWNKYVFVKKNPCHGNPKMGKGQILHTDALVATYKGVNIYRGWPRGLYYAIGFGKADTLDGMKSLIKDAHYKNPKSRKPVFGSAEWQDAMMKSISDKIRSGELLSASDNNFLNTMERHELRHFGRSVVPKLREIYKTIQESSVVRGVSGLRKRVSGSARLNPISKATYTKGFEWTTQLLHENADNPKFPSEEGEIIRLAYASMVSNGVTIPRTSGAWEDFYEGGYKALHHYRQYRGNPQGKGSPAGGGREVRPPKGAVLIGRKVKAVEYYDAPKARAEGLSNPNMPWRHDYKVGGKVYGLPDGSVLIKHPKGKKLWGYR